VPHDREHEQRQELDPDLHSMHGKEERPGDEIDEPGEQHEASDRHQRGSDGEVRHRRQYLGKRPCGLIRKTARKTMCPASTCQARSNGPRMACATPGMMPPASVPQRLPSPPRTTASKAISSRLGPLVGSKLVHTDMKPADTAMVMPTRPMA